MITLNRMRHRWVHAKVRIESRLAVARANRIKARTLRTPNPGYDELRHSVFLVVMALGLLAVVVDVAEEWDGVLWAASMVVDAVRAFGLGA